MAFSRLFVPPRTLPITTPVPVSPSTAPVAPKPPIIVPVPATVPPAVKVPLAPIPGGGFPQVYVTPPVTPATRLPISTNIDPKAPSSGLPDSKVAVDPIVRFQNMPTAPQSMPPIEPSTLSKPTGILEGIYGRLEPVTGGNEQQRQGVMVGINAQVKQSILNRSPALALDPTKGSGLDWAKAPRTNVGIGRLGTTDPLDVQYASNDKLTMPEGTTQRIANEGRLSDAGGVTAPTTQTAQVTLPTPGTGPLGNAFYLIVAAVLAFMVIRRG